MSIVGEWSPISWLPCTIWDFWKVKFLTAGREDMCQRAIVISRQSVKLLLAIFLFFMTVAAGILDF